MVIASHLIFSAYGFWLPNDPRGSWSEFVRSWDILQFGRATKTDDHRSVAHHSHDRELRLAAKRALRYPPVRFTGRQALAIAHGFSRAIRESGYALTACAIMPDHVHAVVLRHETLPERIIGHLKTRATQQLLAEGLHPFGDLRDRGGRVPGAWAHHGWKVFLDSESDVERAVKYVRENPTKAGMREQAWSFVAPVREALRKRSS